jgi:hypothetical protein
MTAIFGWAPCAKLVTLYRGAVTCNEKILVDFLSNLGRDANNTNWLNFYFTESLTATIAKSMAFVQVGLISADGGFDQKHVTTALGFHINGDGTYAEDTKHWTATTAGGRVIDFREKDGGVTDGFVAIVHDFGNVHVKQPLASHPKQRKKEQTKWAIPEHLHGATRAQTTMTRHPRVAAGLREAANYQIAAAAPLGPRPALLVRAGMPGGMYIATAGLAGWRPYSRCFAEIASGDAAEIAVARELAAAAATVVEALRQLSGAERRASFCAVSVVDRVLAFREITHDSFDARTLAAALPHEVSVRTLSVVERAAALGRGEGWSELDAFTRDMIVRVMTPGERCVAFEAFLIRPKDRVRIVSGLRKLCHLPAIARYGEGEFGELPASVQLEYFNSNPGLDFDELSIKVSLCASVGARLPEAAIAEAVTALDDVGQQQVFAALSEDQQVLALSRLAAHGVLAVPGAKQKQFESLSPPPQPREVEQGALVLAAFCTIIPIGDVHSDNGGTTSHATRPSEVGMVDHAPVATLPDRVVSRQAFVDDVCTLAVNGLPGSPKIWNTVKGRILDRKSEGWSGLEDVRQQLVEVLAGLRALVPEVFYLGQPGELERLLAHLFPARIAPARVAMSAAAILANVARVVDATVEGFKIFEAKELAELAGFFVGGGSVPPGSTPNTLGRVRPELVSELKALRAWGDYAKVAARDFLRWHFEDAHLELPPEPDAAVPP